MKLISVIMPAYNCEKFIKQAIDSILAQTYANFELLIADDCSTDNTKSIIDSYSDSRIKKQHNKVNLGYLKASNKLFNICNGNYISFQDADDYSDPQRFQKLLRFLDENTDIACLGSNIKKVDEQGAEFYTSSFPLTDTEIRASFSKYRIVMTGSSLIVRKEVIEKLGIYNEYFNRIGSEDTYWYSLILDNFKVANLNESLYYYRSNPNSVGATHKDPRSIIGHDLIVLMYQRRLNHQEDFIYSGNWKEANKCAHFLLSINKVKFNKLNGLKAFLINALKYPKISFMFLRPFLSTIKN